VVLGSLVQELIARGLVVCRATEAVTPAKGLFQHEVAVCAGRVTNHSIGSAFLLFFPRLGEYVLLAQALHKSGAASDVVAGAANRIKASMDATKRAGSSPAGGSGPHAVGAAPARPCASVAVPDTAGDTFTPMSFVLAPAVQAVSGRRRAGAEDGMWAEAMGTPPPPALLYVLRRVTAEQEFDARPAAGHAVALSSAEAAAEVLTPPGGGDRTVLKAHPRLQPHAPGGGVAVYTNTRGVQLMRLSVKRRLDFCTVDMTRAAHPAGRGRVVRFLEYMNRPDQRRRWDPENLLMEGRSLTAEDVASRTKPYKAARRHWREQEAAVTQATKRITVAVRAALAVETAPRYRDADGAVGAGAVTMPGVGAAAVAAAATALRAHGRPKHKLDRPRKFTPAAAGIDDSEGAERGSVDEPGDGCAASGDRYDEARAEAAADTVPQASPAAEANLPGAHLVGSPAGAHSEPPHHDSEAQSAEPEGCVPLLQHQLALEGMLMLCGVDPAFPNIDKEAKRLAALLMCDTSACVVPGRPAAPESVVAVQVNVDIDSVGLNASVGPYDWRAPGTDREALSTLTESQYLQAMEEALRPIIATGCNAMAQLDKQPVYNADHRPAASPTHVSPEMACPRELLVRMPLPANADEPLKGSVSIPRRLRNEWYKAVLRVARHMYTDSQYHGNSRGGYKADSISTPEDNVSTAWAVPGGMTLALLSICLFARRTNVRVATYLDTYNLKARMRDLVLVRGQALLPARVGNHAATAAAAAAAIAAALRTSVAGVIEGLGARLRANCCRTEQGRGYGFHVTAALVDGSGGGRPRTPRPACVTIPSKAVAHALAGWNDLPPPPLAPGAADPVPLAGPTSESGGEGGVAGAAATHVKEGAADRARTLPEAAAAAVAPPARGGAAEEGLASGPSAYGNEGPPSVSPASSAQQLQWLNGAPLSGARAASSHVSLRQVAAPRGIDLFPVCALPLGLGGYRVDFRRADLPCEVQLAAGVVDAQGYVPGPGGHASARDSPGCAQPLGARCMLACHAVAADSVPVPGAPVLRCDSVKAAWADKKAAVERDCDRMQRDGMAYRLELYFDQPPGADAATQILAGLGTVLRDMEVRDARPITAAVRLVLGTRVELGITALTCLESEAGEVRAAGSGASAGAALGAPAVRAALVNDSNSQLVYVQAAAECAAYLWKLSSGRGTLTTRGITCAAASMLRGLPIIGAGVGGSIWKRAFGVPLEASAGVFSTAAARRALDAGHLVPGQHAAATCAAGSLDRAAGGVGGGTPRGRPARAVQAFPQLQPHPYPVCRGCMNLYLTADALHSHLDSAPSHKPAAATDRSVHLLTTDAEYLSWRQSFYHRWAATDPVQFRAAHMAVAEGKNVLLLGDAGSGKTFTSEFPASLAVGRPRILPRLCFLRPRRAHTSLAPTVPCSDPHCQRAHHYVWGRRRGRNRHHGRGSVRDPWRMRPGGHDAAQLAPPRCVPACAHTGLTS